MTNAIMGLLNSRKSLICLLAVIGVVAMNLLGKLDADKTIDFIKYLVMTLMGSIAYEDGQMKSNQATSAPTIERLSSGFSFGP